MNNKTLADLKPQTDNNRIINSTKSRPRDVPAVAARRPAPVLNLVVRCKAYVDSSM